MADNPADTSSTPDDQATPSALATESPVDTLPTHVVEAPAKVEPVIAPIDDNVKDAINAYWMGIPISVRYADIAPKAFDKYTAGTEEPQQLSVNISLMENKGRAANTTVGDIDFDIVRGANYPDASLALHYKTLLHRLSAAADAMANAQDIKNISAYKQATVAAIQNYGAAGLEKAIGVIAEAIKKASLAGASKEDKPLPISWVKPITFGAGGAEPRGFAAAALSSAWEKAHSTALEKLRNTLQKATEKGKERKLPLLANIDIWARKFVGALPPTEFKDKGGPRDWYGHWIALSENEVENRGGKDLMDALRKRAEMPDAASGPEKLITGADLDNYSFWYDKDNKLVYFHNKRLDNRATIGFLAKILKAFKSGGPAATTKDLASKLNTTVEEVVNYFRNKLNSLTPDLRSDAEKIMKMTPPQPFKVGEELEVGGSFDTVPFGSFPGEKAKVVSVVDTPEKGYNITLNGRESFYKYDEAHKIFSSKSKLTDKDVAKAVPEAEENETAGLSKKAYGDTWAGPTLDQVGSLIGDYEAKWASELAANLAGKFDYIAFPSMEGGPETLKKIALRLEEMELLPLSEEQQAVATKHFPAAVKMVKAFLPSIDVYEHAKREDDDEPSQLVEGVHTLSDDQAKTIASLALLITVDKGAKGIPLPTTASDKEFMEALRSNIALITHEIKQKGYSGLPDEEAGPEDIYTTDIPPTSLGADKQAKLAGQ